MKEQHKEIWGALNAEQRRAVEQTEGPVLVVAGPGTGKTQLLSSRVAHILKTTDTKPSEVLCLTFTNKAAVNMKDRIIELAGKEGARVPAATFHSFAAEIMNLYPDYFWNAARLTIAPDAVQLDIIESIVGSLPLDNPLVLKFAGQFTLLKDIQGGIKLAKDAGLTPEKLKALIEFNLGYIGKIEKQLSEITAERMTVKKLPVLAAAVESIASQDVKLDYFPLVSLSDTLKRELDIAIEADLPTGKCSNTSRWKSKWLQTVDGTRGMHKERQRNEWWLNLADVYASYRASLHERGFYDYADMLVEVINVLDQNAAIRADVQERYSYVLIDEFQDSTPAQIRLAYLVADSPSSEGKPNLMVVGDDDQTIYKFNGAEVNNMLQLEERYPDVTKIVLTQNYRSTQKILDFSKQVIEQAETRLVKLDKSLSKELVAQPANKGGAIRALAYGGKELQYSAIARDIQKTFKVGAEIAVLARSHDSLVAMAGVLQQISVPIRYEQASNILDHEIVRQVYLVAKLVLAIQAGDKTLANALIHQIIRWPVWGIDPQILWQLAAHNFAKRQWLESLLGSKEPGLKAMGEWFVWLAGVADSQPLAVTIEQILGLRKSGEYTSPIREYFQKSTAGQINAYFHGLSAIQLLRNLAHEFGIDKIPTLEDLVRYVEVNKLNEVIVPDESPFITGDKAVQLMTVHKAKGLEFDAVYIVDAVEGKWQPKAGGRKPPANLPLQPHGDDLDDYIRLMYVAITRAKANVTISGYFQDHSGKDVALSSIIQSVQPLEIQDQPTEPELINILEESLRWPELERGQERTILKARLESFSLNVTHLIHFLDITRGGPEYFKERHLLRLPEVKTSAQAFGTAMHAALRHAQLLANRGEYELGQVITSFEEALAKEQLPQEESKRQLAKGKQEIKKLFEKLKLPMGKESLTEYELRSIRVGEATLAGTLDRIDRDGESLLITDYKTGRPLASFDTKDQTQAIKAYKHKLQLIFYALLAQNAPRLANAKVVNCQIVYVEAQTSKELAKTYQPSTEDIDRLQQLIQAVWWSVQNLELPKVDSYSQDLAGIKAFEQDLIAANQKRRP